MKKNANIRYADGKMFIKTPFEAAFVAELKSTTKTRKWDPAKKQWVVDMGERVQTLDLIKRYYEVVEDNKAQDIPQLSEAMKIELANNLPTDITDEWLSGGDLEIWTDGACSGNPGPGGYGIIFKRNGETKAKSGGFILTTNNRMEIMAVIAALEMLKKKAKVVIYSDSSYVVDSIMKGWAKKWKTNGWKRNSKDKAINPDLWDRLLKLCDLHEVEFRWIRGHDSRTENEWCDEIAVAAAHREDLPRDEGYKP